MYHARGRWRRSSHAKVAGRRKREGACLARPAGGLSFRAGGGREDRDVDPSIGRSLLVQGHVGGGSLANHSAGFPVGSTVSRRLDSKGPVSQNASLNFE
ncbi:hypothetical protein ZWY2020_018580 [Hordeum vulgare]|nr:hypothetical protein ZWY2020_018580 [Hordeum vulgare]